MSKSPATALILMGIGMLTLFYSGKAVVENLIFDSTCARTSAQVVGVNTKKNLFSNGSGTEYFPILAFYALEHRYTFEADTGSNRSIYSPGQIIAIEYNPTNPLQAYIDNQNRNSVNWIYCGVAFCIFIAGAIKLALR